MKKMLIVALAAVAATIGLAGNTLAFHDGGVARCEGCHTMHNSLEGTNMDFDMAQYASGIYLLQGNDQSSVCLNCHEKASDTGPSSYHVSTVDSKLGVTQSPLQRTPGGDFGWLKKTYSWTAHGSPKTDKGERHGHNIIAQDFNYEADVAIATSPGGAYPASAFYCSSCHDPHGQYRVMDAAGTIADGKTTSKPIAASGSYGDAPTVSTAVGVYRILGGSGYKPKSSTAPAFNNDAPIAVAPKTYNATEATYNVRVAYGQGMSEWCANCHAELLEDAYVSGAAGHTHPAANGAVLGDLAANYNKYVKTADLTGTGETYTSLVPFEQQIADVAALKAYASFSADPVLTGPDSTDDNVMCLSCHRAHASGFASMLRWDGDTLITEGTTYNGSTNAAATRNGRTEAEWQAAYYDRAPSVFAVDQRSLCNKCHVKD